MKTDLAMILSVSGQHGLFLYVNPARNGAIVESLRDKKRTLFDAKNRISSLSDISIYSAKGEVKLQEVFEKMHELLGDNDALTAKASNEELKSFFSKAIPDYDEERFYVSHMKKVCEWYNELKNFASLDFGTEESVNEKN